MEAGAKLGQRLNRTMKVLHTPISHLSPAVTWFPRRSCFLFCACNWCPKEKFPSLDVVKLMKLLCKITNYWKSNQNLVESLITKSFEQLKAKGFGRWNC